MSAAPYWSLYCSARDAIKEAAAAAAAPEGSGKNTDEATPSRPEELELQLARLVQETHHSNSSSSQRVDDQASIRSASVVATQEPPGASKRARQDSGHEQETAPPTRNSEDVAEAGEDECLGVLAEAFADDLDDLRKDEHFRGSARDVAAMADMMR
ncbi:unnamed protein product [Laminaria digitata]